MTECEFSQYVSAYADDQLQGPDLERFQEHLADCPACREQLARTRRLGELLAESLQDDSAIDVTDAIRRRIARRKLRTRIIHATAVLATAACVLVVVWLTCLRDQPDNAFIASLDNGADWLVRTQEPEGYWDSCKYGSGFNFDIGLTALSVTALTEAYKRVGDPEMLDAARRGANWLAGQEDRLGRFLKPGDQSRMYGQAAATLALLRLYEEYPDPALHESIQRAITFGIRAQSSGGGWSYVPGISADTSHTGWFVLALARARALGFEVPEPTLAEARSYVNAMTVPDGRVSYTSVGQTSAGLTGTPVAVNACIDGRIDPDSPAYPSARRLLNSTPDWTDREQNLYLWFFASAGLKCTVGIEKSRIWQADLLKTLLVHQDRTSGDTFGSWANNDTTQANAGRVYSTSLAVLCLAQTD